MFDFEAKWDRLMTEHNKSVDEYNKKKANEPKPATLQDRLDNINKSIKK
ncbi:MAG: hypothetical protein J6R59_10735 [Paludibacteraceae bacterium]|nr:hypothetical protein [Paludibacteraceae bacterium]